MSILSNGDRAEIAKRFERLQGAVRIVNFTQEFECRFCNDTRRLLEEVASLSDKISLEVFDFARDREQAEKYGIDKIPAVVVSGDRDFGIRFFGIPAGYEFSTLIEDIIMVSGKDSGLTQNTRNQLARINEALHLQVFVSPTCPYCPKAVFMAHQFAVENENIRADMVEISEFPHLAMRYNVKGVPKSVANEKEVAEGLIPEAAFLERIMQVLK